ncbi:MAG: hypothetical protein RQ753_10880, partial [Desulfurivibrionaceae bacterium]|nr:hypothetical protein [Desulfurivibrionaceae bacterium]
MQGGNDADNTNGISTSCQRSAPLSGAPQGGGVNHGNPAENDYLMQLQTDKAELSSLSARTKPPCGYKVKFPPGRHGFR